MSVENVINVHLELTGLGQQEMIPDSMSTTTTVAKKLHNYQTQAVADTEEALNVGDITVIEYVWIHCHTNDVDVDTNFDTTFNACITVQEGEFACFKPAGDVYICNNSAQEQSVVEYIVLGSA